METLEQFWHLVFERSGHGIGYVVVSILGVIAWLFIRYVIQLFQRFWCFLRSRQRALKAVAREVTKEGAREGKGIWLTTPIYAPDNYGKHQAASKILSIANLKGGIGKTTLAANIGAYFACEWGKRVLLIDLDFQGSLSSMALPAGDWIPGPNQSSIATRLISNDIKPDLVAAVAQKIELGARAHPDGRLKIITAYYDLAQADNRIMVEWLIQCSPKKARSLRDTLVGLLTRTFFRTQDVRYTLAEILHSDAVDEAFDLVVIDCPPRLTTGEIQAFCASSHILIPTILDRPSAEAVASLCLQIETLKTANICPKLDYIGVVGTMVEPNLIAQNDALRFIQDRLASIDAPIGLLLQDTFIPETTTMVRNADAGIAYLTMGNGPKEQEARAAFRALSAYIANQMGIRPPPQFQALRPAASEDRP